MDDMSGLALRGFGVKAQRVVKEKACFILVTGKGQRVLRRVAESPERLRFQFTVTEHLYASGFRAIERMYPGLDGEPFAQQEGGLYVMTDLLRYREFDFRSPEEFTGVLETVAALHTHLRGVDFPGEIFREPGSLLETAAGHLRFLQGVRKKIHQLSDFDVLFLKNYAYYTEALQAAVAGLGAAGYEALARQAQAANMLCHKNLKEETVLLDPAGRPWLADFSQACVAPELSDLAALIQRHGKKSAAPMAVAQALEIYNRRNPLPPGGEAVVRAMLRYPAKFIKTCQQYYSKKRSWAPGAMINCMRQIVEGRAAYDGYVLGSSSN
jgi:CotS family spore coat protein